MISGPEAQGFAALAFVLVAAIAWLIERAVLRRQMEEHQRVTEMRLRELYEKNLYPPKVVRVSQVIINGDRMKADFGLYGVPDSEVNDDLSKQADRLFGKLAAMMPRHLASEELGDALEEVERRNRVGRPRKETQRFIYGCAFWAVVHTLLYLVERITHAIGRKSN